MVTIGADLHKRTHTLVAVDQNGRKLTSVINGLEREIARLAVHWHRRCSPCPAAAA